MNESEIKALSDALSFWAKYIEVNADKMARPEFERGRASAYRNLVLHIEARGDLSGFINSCAPYKRGVGA